MSLKRTSCKLNSDGSVCLNDLVKAFNSSISEEHAWALCYQCCKYFQNLGSGARENCLTILELSHVFLQTDGNVHPNTFFIENCASTSSTCRERLQNERDFIQGLGLVLFQTLDQGSGDQQERALHHDLQQFIEDLISEKSAPGETHNETDDEGIEKDSEESELVINKITNVQQVIQRCERHVTVLTKAQAETHYKAVVRAIVNEALELSTFLDKVSQYSPTEAGGSISEVDHLHLADWARYWVQVVAQLRMGVKLRKVNYSRAPIEYELTPVEILMKDIRSCRYTLKKVMVDGDIPHRVTKDAHAIILEFIRSRPPLKKVSDRKLPPLIKNLTPREKLLLSIRKGRKLNTVRNIPNLQLETSETDLSAQQEKSTRKLIKIDLSLLQDDDDDDEMQADNSSESDGPGLWPQEEYQQLWDKTLDAYDLATQGTEYCDNVRRNTLEVINPTFESQSVPQSRPGSRQSCNSSEPDSYMQEMSRSLQDHLTNGSAKCWPEGMSLEDRLSLTLEEIMHIRSVLTKADIEALPVEARVRSDVENRKVCFLCLKTRFGIFGPWGQRCIVCKRTICSRCYSKLNIPMEHFTGIPVALLSPSVLATPDDDYRSEATGSSNKVTPESESPQQMISNQGTPTQNIKSISNRDIESSAMRRFKNRAQVVSRAAGVVDKLKGSQMVVCHDCKMMLQQIIKSARTNRTAIRNKTLQNLSLNLSPVF